MYPKKETHSVEKKIDTDWVAPQKTTHVDFEAHHARIAVLDESARLEEYHLLRERADAALKAMNASPSYETIIPCQIRAAEHFAFGKYIAGASEAGWQLTRDVLHAAKVAGLLPKHRRPYRRRTKSA